MSVDLVFKYWKALKAIRANQQKADIETAIFPNLTKGKDRDAVMRDLSNAFKLNVSDGDYARERKLEAILKARDGERKNRS